MPAYNFKRETKLYVVRDNLRYAINIYPDLSFSQTFDETAVQVKTLHSQYDSVEDAVITKANPANFSFTIPVILNNDLDVIFDLLLNYDLNSAEAILKTADLYLQSNSVIYKLEKAVIESGTFNIQKDSVLLLSVSGSAARLSTYTEALPGILQTPSTDLAFSYVNAMYVAVNNDVQNAITSVSIEVKNDVEWVGYATIQDSISNLELASGVHQTPGAFVVRSRTLNGTIQQYITEDMQKYTNTWSTSASIDVKVGSSDSNWALQFLIPRAVYTNRSEMQDLLIQSYDFRMTANVPFNTVILKRSI